VAGYIGVSAEFERMSFEVWIATNVPLSEQGIHVEIVPRGYLQISFLQPLRECQRSKGISRSKTLVVIVWVLEYFEINEMNLFFVCFHWGMTCDSGLSFVSSNYGVWVVIMVLVIVFGLFVMMSEKKIFFSDR
jgi:hypothetical protein